MVSSWKRIAMATSVSIMGCVLTYLWHIKNNPKASADSDAEIIAYIAKTKNEIHRKGSNNALWEPAENLDRLRAGDSVRSSGNSEARIQFYRSDRYVDLEADSMIVIQKQESEINLELLEGSLFVNGVDKNNKEKLTLKSQSGKVDLSKSTAQLTGSSNTTMDLRVLKGSAQVMKSSGKTEAIQEGKAGDLGLSGLQVSTEKVKILSPDMTKPYFVNAIAPDPLMIQWTGFPQNAQVELESGPSRKKLLPTPSEKPSPSQLEVRWKPGIYYWKLKAYEKGTQKLLAETNVYKTEIVGRFPPTPIAPVPNFTVQTRHSAEKITLRWNASQEYKNIFVELQNENSKQKVVNQRFPASQDFYEIPNLPLGNYSWRLTAYPEDGGRPISGPINKFSINQKRLIKIPVIWNANLQATQYFVNTEPKLTLMWEPDTSERVVKWRTHIAPEGIDLNKAEIADTTQIKFDKVMTKPGRYLAYVEALDEEGDNIGTSEVRTFAVASLPLLTAPELLPDDGSEYLARPDGSLPLQWEPLDGAQNYQISVSDKDGKIIVEHSASLPSFTLTNLMPGQYTIQVGATDTYGRKGAISEKRSILVPDKSEVQAPKLKKIKVN